MTRRHGVLVGLLMAILAIPAAAKTPAGKTGVPPRAHSGEAARTLDDIHIEGEIPVPQILFITARDQRRFMEFQHRRYLRSSRKLGDDTLLPSSIIVTGTRPTQGKETSR